MTAAGELLRKRGRAARAHKRARRSVLGKHEDGSAHTGTIAAAATRHGGCGRHNVAAVVLRCPACDSPLPSRSSLSGSDRMHGVPGRFEVVVCERCGSGRTLPLVPSPKLGSLYPGPYSPHGLPEARPARAVATALFRWRYWRALRRPPFRVLAERRAGRLLDVGSGRGDLGVVLARRGWSVTGLEPSPEACAEARSRGVTSVCGTLETAADQLDCPYDAAVFQHSLEHVAEPADDLLRARRLLAPAGLLIVSLPNFGSLQARRFGANWFHLDLPRHRSHFTRRGLELLLRRLDFVDPVVSTSSSADGLPMSLLYRFADRGPSSGPARYLAIAGVLALSPLGALLDRASGAGDVLHALARRPVAG
jgi:SAM-dependent methyltransferase